MLEFQLNGVFNSGRVYWLTEFVSHQIVGENFIGLLELCVFSPYTWLDTMYWFSLLLYCIQYRAYVFIFDDLET